MTTEATEPQLTESEVDRLASRGPLTDFGGLANLSIAERDALIRDWRALREFVYVPQILPNDELLTYRDEAERLLRENAALREQLTEAQRVIDAACALSCAGCAANLPLTGTVHKPTPAQSKLGYEPAECEAKGAARVSQEITETLK